MYDHSMYMVFPRDEEFFFRFIRPTDEDAKVLEIFLVDPISS